MENIRDWYMTNFPTDDMGKDLKPISARDLYKALLDRESVYETIGVTDSLVRERIFGGIAEELGVPYNTIYYIWQEDFKKALMELAKGERE